MNVLQGIRGNIFITADKIACIANLEGGIDAFPAKGLEIGKIVDISSQLPWVRLIYIVVPIRINNVLISTEQESSAVPNQGGIYVFAGLDIIVDYSPAVDGAICLFAFSFNE